MTTVFSVFATQEQIAYWDKHGVEVCPHVRDGSRAGYCLGPECRPCMWRRNGVDPEKIKSYEDFEDKSK